MRVGINWIFGNPVGPTAPSLVDPGSLKWLADVKGLAGVPLAPMAGASVPALAAVPAVPPSVALVATVPNPNYAPPGPIGISAISLAAILLIARFARGFIANISVLLGIVVAAVLAAAMGMMSFERVARARWFDLVLPFEIALPAFDPVLILTMSLVMIVVMIESTGMFLALGDMTGKAIDRPMLTRGLRTDGLGTIIGGVFNTFPYTSFSQNVGLVGVTGVKSRYVCAAGGAILIVLGLLPKMAALVESLPTFVLGGALAFAISEIVGLAAAIWPHAWLGLFGHDPQMLETGAAYLRVVGPTYGFFGLGLSLYFASQGAGKLAWPLIGGMLRLLIAVGGGWLAMSLTGSLAWAFAVLALALVVYGATIAAAVASGSWFRR